MEKEKAMDGLATFARYIKDKVIVGDYEVRDVNVSGQDIEISIDKSLAFHLCIQTKCNLARLHECFMGGLIESSVLFNLSEEEQARACKSFSLKNESSRVVIDRQISEKEKEIEALKILLP